MANPVSHSELANALENVAWELAQAEAEKIPPYLDDDDLTVERFWQKNKDKMSKVEARSILDRMAEPDGPLEKQLRRKKGKGVPPVVVYVAKQ